MKILLHILFYLCLLSMACYGQVSTPGINLNTSDSQDGFTFFAPVYSNDSYLIDNCGNLIHTWPSDHLPGLAVYLLEDGSILRTEKVPGGGGPGGGGQTGQIEIIDWDGNVIWEYTTENTFGRQHHDVEMLPNGNILFIVWDEHSQSEMTQAGSSTTQSAVNSEQIIEVEPNYATGGATVVWEWRAWDHIIQDSDPSKPGYGVIGDHPEKIDINYIPHNDADWLHINGIAYHEQFDQIILSVHGFNELWIIDHSTTTAEAAGSTGGDRNKGGDLLYRWGNPAAYDQGSPNDKKLFRQHHTHWIPEGYPDEGKIIVFNNQTGGTPPNGYSTVDILDPAVSPNGDYNNQGGGAFGPTNFSWTYEADNPQDFYSNIISGASQLSNGNVLICEGITGRFFEVNPNTQIVWEYQSPVSSNGILGANQSTAGESLDVFRVSRFSRNYSAFVGKDTTVKGTVETNGNTSSCILYDSGVTDERVSLEESIQVYPVPTSEFLMIDHSYEIERIEVFDLSGKLREVSVESMNNYSSRIDCRKLPDGVYFVRINNQRMARVVICK